MDIELGIQNVARTVTFSTEQSADEVNNVIAEAVENGKITEDGTHQQLIAKQGYYYQLYTNQFQEEQGLEILDEAMAKA